MIITPELKMKEHKILDIFKRMTWEEQNVVVGYLSEFAYRSYQQAKSTEGEVQTYQTSAKIINFPAVATM